MKEDKLYLTNNKGEKKEYDILFTFNDLENGYCYVIYTDNIENENGLELYAVKYNLDNEEINFEVVEKEEEWAKINIVTADLQNKLRYEE